MILVDLPDSCGAIVKIHHVISDAWSVMLIANQFLSVLNGTTPDAYEYSEFLENNKKYLESSRCKKDRVFFEQQLATLSEPTRVWPQAYTSLEARRRTVVLDKTMTGEILDYAKNNNVTPYSLFLTAICIFMHKKMKRDQFYVGSVVINRTGYREKNTVGIFVMGVPILMEINDDMSFEDTVLYITERSFKGLRHGKGIPRSKDTKKYLYDVWVSYQNATLDADKNAECTQYYCNCALDTTIFSIEDRSSDMQFKMHFDYNIKVPESDVDELFDTVINVLKKGTENDSLSISSLI